MAKKKVVVPVPLTLKLRALSFMEAGSSKPHAIVSWRTGKHDHHRSGKFGILLSYEAESSSAEVLPMEKYGVYTPGFKQQVIDWLMSPTCTWDWKHLIPDVTAESFEIAAVELHHLHTGVVHIQSVKQPQPRRTTKVK